MSNSEQPTYIRQRYLLAFIGDLHDKNISRTNLQKLIFLNAQYTETSYYDFIPYKFGPYSFQLDKDVDVLYLHGYLDKTDSKIHVKKHIRFDFEKHIIPERGEDLLRRVYREFPYYALNSTIISRLFTQDEADYILSKGKISHEQGKDILFTIGYEGRTLESFINILIQNGIKLLCDVRKNPISRKFGFSEKMLKSVISSTGIKYISVPELGIDSVKRTHLECAEDYNALFADYRADIDSRTRYMEKIQRLIEKYHSIALMCYEKDPNMCHRNIIRERMTELYGTESINL